MNVITRVYWNQLISCNEIHVDLGVDTDSDLLCSPVVYHGAVTYIALISCVARWKDNWAIRLMKLQRWMQTFN